MTSNPWPRRSVAVLLAFVVLVGFGPPAWADDDGDEEGGGQVITHAIAVVEVDDGREFDHAFEIYEFGGDVVDHGNLAFAHANGCQGCQAVALSFQIVLAQASPSEVVPENLALAVNQECDTCDAAAGAYQFVVAKPVRLTGAGRAQLQVIRREVRALESSGLTGPEMVMEADALADEVRAVLKAELRPIEDDDDDDESDDGELEDRRSRRLGEDQPEQRSSTKVPLAA